MLNRRSIVSRRCPARRRLSDEPSFEEQLEVLREDIRATGGPDAWVFTRLEEWLDGAEPIRKRSLL